jgi:hypothetical protein
VTHSLDGSSLRRSRTRWAYAAFKTDFVRSRKDLEDTLLDASSLRFISLASFHLEHSRLNRDSSDTNNSAAPIARVQRTRNSWILDSCSQQMQAPDGHTYLWIVESVESQVSERCRRRRRRRRRPRY